MFIQPCFIKKNTPELKKKLEELGYNQHPSYGDNGQYLHLNRGFYHTNVIGYSEEIERMIDCGTNEELFLALASLRDDSDYLQWFTNGEEWFQNKQNNIETIHYGTSNPITFHKATVGEIIEHFKNKMIMSIPENMTQITNLASHSIKEESSAVNPILPKDNLFAMQGWQCPICKRVYSPFTHMCMYCGNKEAETITLPKLPNTVGLAQEQNNNFKNQTPI